MEAADVLESKHRRLFFWRQRPPGFDSVRAEIEQRARSQMSNGSAACRYQDLSGQVARKIDRLVFQVLAIRQTGRQFDLKVTYHPRVSQWVSDGGKRDSWEKFEDCHTEHVQSYEWYGVELLLREEVLKSDGA